MTPRPGDAKTRKLVQQPDYIIDIIHRSDSGSDWYLYREIIFERVNLGPPARLFMTPRA